MNTETFFPLFLDFLVKTSLIVLLAGLVQRLWRKPTAAQRYFIWNMALIALFVLPMWNRTHPEWVIPLGKQTAKAEAPALPALPAIVVASEPMESQPVVVELAPAPSRWTMPDWRSVVLAIWIGGGVLLIGRRLVGSWQLYRLKKRSAVVADERVAQLTQRVLSELKIKRRVAVRISTECQVPLTWGDWRPVVLLPAEALTWSDESLLAALRHEAGHIGQRHYADRLIADLVCAGYWVNPLVWLAAHQLRSVQEQATDDVVLHAGTSAEDYAAQLCAAARTVVERGVFKRPAMAMVNRSTLESRVVNILDASRKRQPLTLNARRVGMMVTLFAVFVINLVQLKNATAADKDGTPGAVPKETALAAEKPAVSEPADSTVLELLPIRVEGDPAASTDKPFTLHVPIKAKALDPQIDVPELVVHVLFYDRINGGEISPTNATVNSHWLTPPADWTESGTEELAVDYLAAKTESGSSEKREYFGYLVRVYYQRKLQSEAAEPASLLALYPGTKVQMPTASSANLTEIEAAYVAAVEAMTEGEKLEQNGQIKGAIGKMRSALRSLARVSTLDPQWQQLLVAYRKVRAEAAIKRLVASIPVPEVIPVVESLGAGSERPSPTLSDNPVLAKAQQIIIPVLDFRETPLEEAVDFLRIKSKELDPEKKGVNLIMPKDLLQEAKITVSLTNIPLIEAVRYTAGLAGLEVKAETYALLLQKPVPKNAASAPARSGDLPVANVATSAAAKKAEEIILPSVNFRGATIDEALDFLRKKARDLDPKKEGVPLLLQGGAGADAEITINLTAVPLLEAVRYVANLAGLEVVADSYGLTLRLPEPGQTTPGPELAKVSTSTSAAARKAAGIVIPRIELREATVEEAVDFLRIKARELDPEKKGVNLVLQKGVNPEARISLSLTNVPLREALRYIASLADLEISAEPEALSLRPMTVKPAAEAKSATPAPDGSTIPPVKAPVPTPAVAPKADRGGNAARGPAGATDSEDKLGLRKPLIVEPTEKPALFSSDKPAVKITGDLQLRMTVGDRAPVDRGSLNPRVRVDATTGNAGDR